ncbi:MULTISPECIES: hypothetical protein [Sphingomonas]|uniref:Lipoprotein n=1 Tax=Sphingomonas kyungheensis TaxID=1069987 RepID=A0ABU8H120_9SPHN|nr:MULTISPECIES: hypothetical protein [unclassified Sphingomonas]EZP57355.1 putative lipoprotein [Sphingomonas sp. RIT328]
MKTTMMALAAGAMALSLAACGGKGDDKLGSEVKAAADNRADAMESAADNLEDQAKAERKSAAQQADAIDDADVNAAAMSSGEKAALINGSDKLR